MTNTATLNPTQPKKETKLNPSQVIGGVFEEMFENVTGIVPPSFEAREPIKTPAPEYIKKAFSSGEINDFQKPKLDPEIEIRKLQSQLIEAHQEALTKQPITAKRIDVNTKFGVGNVLYEDTVSDDFTLRRDVEAYLSRINSELEAKQVKAKRENSLVQATTKRSVPKGAVGPTVNLNTAFEDQNLNRPG